MKKHSTGALSDDQRWHQDDVYRQHSPYDVVIVGTGMAALTTGALLAHSGRRVCMLEAHDRPGGMAHTFAMGDYHFCAQVHYIWGCGPGGAIHEFLKKIGLERDITFELLDRNGYDRVVLPDGVQVRFPYGFKQLVANVERAFPGQEQAARRFVTLMERIHDEIERLPRGPLTWWRLLTQGWRFPTLIRYRNRTVQQVLDECEVSPPAQAIFVANAGDLMAPPRELSIFAYTQLVCGYNDGAYYPTRHFRYMIERIERFIKDRGGHIFYEMPVTRIEVDQGRVRYVETRDGKTFTAPHYICNMDPQQAAALIGLQHFPGSWKRPLEYTYSPSGVVIYLGLAGLDLREFGFGAFNTWHLEQWDMNRAWREQTAGDFTRPWLFLATPTLHTPEPGLAPPGGQVLEVATYADYHYFRKLQDKDYREYAHRKQELAERMLDVVERHYIPNLRRHIAVKVVGTPMTHEDFCSAPWGNAYGSYLSPAQLGLGRLTARTPFDNLWWCNASSGSAGIHGTTCTGVALYEQLTGDRVVGEPNGHHPLAATGLRAAASREPTPKFTT
jgi:all-trans-retinol 13,14-reductase